MKVEVTVLGSLSRVVLNNYCLCRRKATVNLNFTNTDLGNCVKVEVVVMGSLSLIVLMVCVDVKQH